MKFNATCWLARYYQRLALAYGGKPKECECTCTNNPSHSKEQATILCTVAFVKTKTMTVDEELYNQRVITHRQTRACDLYHLPVPLTVPSTKTANTIIRGYHITQFCLHIITKCDLKSQGNSTDPYFHMYPLNNTLRSVLWRCWLDARKGIWPVKNWMVGCWHGYVCISLYPDWFYSLVTFLVPAHPGSPGQNPRGRKMAVCV